MDDQAKQDLYDQEVRTLIVAQLREYANLTFGASKDQDDRLKNYLWIFVTLFAGNFVLIKEAQGVYAAFAVLESGQLHLPVYPFIVTFISIAIGFFIAILGLQRAEDSDFRTPVGDIRTAARYLRHCIFDHNDTRNYQDQMLHNIALSTRDAVIAIGRAGIRMRVLSLYLRFCVPSILLNILAILIDNQPLFTLLQLLLLVSGLFAMVWAQRTLTARLELELPPLDDSTAEAAVQDTPPQPFSTGRLVRGGVFRSE